MNVDVPPATPTSSTSLSLLERAKGREADAWTKIVTLYGPEVYQWLRCRGLQEDDANDLRQEVFKSVFEGLPNFRRDRAGQTFRGWLRTITRNKFNDRFRRLQKDPVTFADHEAFDRLPDRADAMPVDCAADEGDEDDASADARLVHRVLGMLRDEFKATVWQAFWGVAVEGRSPQEVAASLGVSRAAVYKARTRVLHRLHQEFDDLLDDEGKDFSAFA